MLRSYPGLHPDTLRIVRELDRSAWLVAQNLPDRPASAKLK